MVQYIFRLKSHELLRKYGKGKSLYQVAKDGDLNYSTVYRWVNSPEQVQGIKGEILLRFLVGLGLSIDDINQLPLQEVFALELGGEEEM